MVALIHLCFPSVVCRHSCFTLYVLGSSQLSSLQARGQTCPAGGDPAAASPSVPKSFRLEEQKGALGGDGVVPWSDLAGKEPRLGNLGFGWAHRGHSCHLSGCTGVCHTLSSSTHRCHLSPVPPGVGGTCCGQDTDPSLPSLALPLNLLFIRKKTQTDPRGLSILHDNSSSPCPCPASQNPCPP